MERRLKEVEELEPAFAEMIQECGAEFCLCIPRLVWLHFLQDPQKPRRRVDASTHRRVDASTRRRVDASTRQHGDASTRQRHVDASTRRLVDETVTEIWKPKIPEAMNFAARLTPNSGCVNGFSRSPTEIPTQQFFSSLDSVVGYLR